MTPEEKAISLTDKFIATMDVLVPPREGDYVLGRNAAAVKQAIICVEEILSSSDHAGGHDDYWRQVLCQLKKWQ